MLGWLALSVIVVVIAAIFIVEMQYKEDQKYEDEGGIW
jgi:hypothetical protein